MIKLQNIRNKYPAELEMITRLENLLGLEDAAVSEYSLEYLYETIHPDSISRLVEIISTLISDEILMRKIRVVSPESGAGLRDFDSLTQLPDTIFDEVDTGKIVPVTDKMIEVLYSMK